MLILRSRALQLGRLARASTAAQPQLQQRRILSSSAEERVKERKGPMLPTDAARIGAHPMFGATIKEPVYIGKYA
jgi:prephenate dehydrogenase